VPGPGTITVALAVIDDLDLKIGGRVAQRHAGVCGTGVLEGVGERFLNDPKRGDVHAGRQIERLALDGQLDRKPGRGEACQQLVDASQARLWSKGQLRVVLTQHSEQAAHLGQRLLPGALNLIERPAGLNGAGGQFAPAAARLQHHDADGVRDDVMQLPRDSRALLRNGLARLGVALALQFYRSSL
jgi:hypothetical protein